MSEEIFTEIEKMARTTTKSFALTAILATIAPVFFVITTIIGAIRWFSPVPFWDMWDGTVQFMFDLKSFGLAAFFEQANEHRIVFSKVLFWLDYQLFGGLSYMLITMNLVFMAVLWASLAVAARAMTDRRLAYIVSMLAGVLCFSWLQSENINWGYQSQFYLAYLIPLLALINMARWIHEPIERRFVASVLLGAASAFSMANGLIALPLLVVMLFVAGRATVVRVAILLAMTAATIAVWLHHYHQIPRPGAPIMHMAAFLLMFFGAPAYWVFKSDAMAMLMGASAIACGIYFAWCWIVGKTRDPMFLGLVVFIAYIGAAGAAATLGRTFFGLGAALAGRYETPVMLLYATIAIMFAHLHREGASTSAVFTTLALATFFTLLAPQLGALDSAAAVQITSQRMLAALALDLDVRDNATIGSVYPVDTEGSVKNVHAITERAKATDLGIFGLPTLHDAREALGKTPVALGLAPCRSNIEIVKIIPTDDGHIQLNGWAFNERMQTTPKLVYFVENGLVSGAALTGGERPDVQRAISPKAIKTGFEGYANANGKESLQVVCAK